MPGSQLADISLAVALVIEKAVCWVIPTYVAKIDIKKAFDMTSISGRNPRRKKEIRMENSSHQNKYRTKNKHSHLFALRKLQKHASSLLVRRKVR